MASQVEHGGAEGSRSSDGTTRSWLWWTALIVAVIGLAFVGGWVIGLAPGYTAALVGTIVVGSFIWMAATLRGAGGAVSLVGVAGRVVVTGAVVLIVVQLLPIGRDHSNPPVTGEPAWSSPQTRELMVSACYSCHSNEVEWPWYSNIAPMSWAISDHVDAGREAVNFSEFATDPGEADESIEEILDGSMPPAYFTRFGLHSEADLSAEQRAELVAGLRATPGLGDDDGGGREDSDRGDDDEDDDEDDDDD